MARPLRIQYPGALYHVISRGNRRGRIVLDRADREKRLDWLRRTVETYGWRLHAFVLMGNHEHLFVETPEANLAAGMQYLNGSYTSYFNRRHRRCGHLFQGRYRGHLVEEDGHYLEMSRYLHLNPVRARLAERPERWPWGSCPGYFAPGKALPWVTYDRVLAEFGGGNDDGRRAYAAFVRAGIKDRPPSPFREAAGGLLVGSAAFVERIGRLLAGRPGDKALPQLQRLRARPSLEVICAAVGAYFGREGGCWGEGTRSDDASRAVAAYLARRRFGYSAGEVAAALGYRSHGSVRNAVARVEAGTGLLTDIEKLFRPLTND
jgi:REP element-mobilizing transposase RayT